MRIRIGSGNRITIPKQFMLDNNIIDKKIISEYNLDSSNELSIDIEDYIDSASTYQYVFKKVDDRYIFESFNLLD